jgi:hypothetical protein
MASGQEGGFNASHAHPIGHRREHRRSAFRLLASGLEIAQARREGIVPHLERIEMKTRIAMAAILGAMLFGSVFAYAKTSAGPTSARCPDGHWPTMCDNGRVMCNCP